MRATHLLHELGQSIWLDHITRDLLDTGMLARYIEEMSVTGLTSNPTIFERAMRTSPAYDRAIKAMPEKGQTAEEVFFELAIDDLARAADLFRSVHQRTDRVDGWVSLELSPLLARDTQGSIRAARSLFARAARPNLFIKIPGTPEGLPAIEETIYSGVPVNVTLLFSCEQYLAAAEAYLRGIERRVDAGLNPHVASVASIFVSRWDAAVADQAPAALRNRLGIAMAGRIYRASQDLLGGPRWRRMYNAGGRPQRPLWASTGTKDPTASETLYVEALAAPLTVTTLPEATLLALARRDRIGATMAPDGGDCEQVLASFAAAGFDLDALAARLQEEGAKAFADSWDSLIQLLGRKRSAAGAAGTD